MIGSIFNKDLKSVDRFRDASRGVPARCPLLLHPELEALLSRLFLTQPDGCDRRNGEGDARYTQIVWLQVIALQHVGGDDLRIVTRDRCQWRAAHGRVAGGINRRIGDALEKFIELEAALVTLHT